MHRILFLLIAVSVCKSAIAQTPLYVPKSGLISWYPYSGNTKDSSINGFNGTNTGATLTTDRFGRSGSAYSFNGNNDIISTIGNHNSLTVSIWFYLAGAPTTNYPNIFSYGSLYATCLGPVYSSKKGMISLNYSESSVKGALSNSVPSYKNWHHFVGVLNSATGYEKLYIDGIFQSQTAVTVGPSNKDFSIGHENGSTQPGAYWIGSLDDVGIWNRELDTNEIKELYNVAPCRAVIKYQDTAETVKEGANATFKVTTVGNATYKWQADINGSFTDLTDTGKFSGSHTSSLHVGNTPYSYTGKRFRCISIDSSACTDTSDYILLTVIPCTVNIITQPADDTVNAGKNTLLSIKASGSVLKYQWQQNDGLGFKSLSDAGVYSGTSGSALTITNCPLSLNNYSFRCIITDSVLCRDTSALAKLIVNKGSGIITVGEQLGQIILYPNPAHTEIIVSTPQISNSVYSIKDCFGRILINGLINQPQTAISITDLPAGIYIMEINYTANSSRLKFVKN